MGLGNPGAQYRSSRHNLGFMVVRVLADTHGALLNQRKFHSRFGRCRIDHKDVLLVQPITFMNLSGVSVGRWVKHLKEKFSSLIVIHDDMDLPFDRIRIRPRGGHGGHRGIQSIMETLGTDHFVRVKIGIGRPEQWPPEIFVLQPFSQEESRQLEPVIRRGCEAVEAVIKEGLESAMNRFNAPILNSKGTKAE
ncbi:MAG: aminoacyl-tRNA hydrolase [Deltaproteobacteria bacterium]|nr:aminoacyl-tRNA hydrolase [Deltaproteobacteria bacterium]